MSTNTLQLRGGDTLVISPTQLDKVKTCLRLWKHNYIDLRVAAGAAPARDGGKSYDAAMNLRYTRMGSSAADDATEAAMIQASQDAFAGIDLDLEEWRTPARYADAIRLYNQRYKDEPFEILGVQLPFEVVLGEVPVSREFYWARGVELGAATVKVRLHGILDLLIRQNGLVLVADTKTKGKWGECEQVGYDNNAQMKAYCWAIPQMRAQLGDAAGPPWATLPDKVDGAMVNAVVLRKPYVREGSASKANALPRTEFHRFVVTYSDERWRSGAVTRCTTLSRR
jgi:hypothetical protein